MLKEQKRRLLENTAQIPSSSARGSEIQIRHAVESKVPGSGVNMVKPRARITGRDVPKKALPRSYSRQEFSPL